MVELIIIFGIVILAFVIFFYFTKKKSNKRLPNSNITIFGNSKEAKHYHRLKNVSSDPIENWKKTLTEIESEISFPEKSENKREKIKVLINSSIDNKNYISFNYGNRPALVKPTLLQDKVLSAFCFVKNEIINFNIDGILNPELKQNIFLYKFGNIIELLSFAIEHRKYIRVRYSRPLSIAASTIYGKLFQDNSGNVITSLRTLKEVKYSLDVLPENEISLYKLNNDYITGYCFLREEYRTFRIDRIEELEILDI